jgi:hypothetical protein
MQIHLDRAQPGVALVMGAIGFAAIAVLMAWDFFPAPFPACAHDVLGALPLVLIALAWLAHRAYRRPGRNEIAKAVRLAVAFLLWAANHLWPDLPQATHSDDLAIGSDRGMHVAGKWRVQATGAWLVDRRSHRRWVLRG